MGSDQDEVCKSQWLSSGKTIKEINLYLSNVKDEKFVISQCLEIVGDTEEAMKALLSLGLRLTDRYKFSESEDDENSQIWDFRICRLKLLQFRDRLETFLGINMGRFSVQEYSRFRVKPIDDVALTLAESGKIGALNLLFKRHPYSLTPSMLQILAAIPETVPVQTYTQLLPGSSPLTSIAMREEDWVECDKMVNYIKGLHEDHEIDIHIRTEYMTKQFLGCSWPSIDELSSWYKNRARDIDCYSGQLDNCLYLVEFACRKGICELQQFHEDISYLHQLIYSEDDDAEMCFSMSLLDWEKLSDYEKFKMMLKGVKDEKVVENLRDKAITFLQSRSPGRTAVSQWQLMDDHVSTDYREYESFLVRWMKEIAVENKIETCLMVFEEGCKDIESSGFFRDEAEAVDCALQCIYLCNLTDRWSTMSAILSRLPQKQDICVEDLQKRLKLAEGHIEAGRLLAFYQVPKPMNFFLEAHSDEKGVKQIFRLILSKFIRRQPGRSDIDWANMWRDMQLLRDKAFLFLDLEYVLMEFCRGMLKAGKFSLARNYLKGTSSVALASEKAETLIIQAAREYFFSASSLACSEIWKAKECLSLFPSSRNVKAEADVIDVLTVRLPTLGVTLLPMQFRQIKDPIEIIKMAVTSQVGAYVHVDELIEIARLLGLNSPEDICAVEEAIAREAAVAGDLQLAFDLCLVLAKKGHGLIWDLCAAIARGPALEKMDISSRKQLLGFALSHCDEESISELLLAWKDLDMQGQCESLMTLTGTNSPNFSVQGSSVISRPGYSIHDLVDLKDCSELVEVVSSDDQKVHFMNIKNTLSIVAKNLPVQNGINWESLFEDNGKVLSFSALQLPWLLELNMKPEYGKKMLPGLIPGKHYVSIRTQTVLTILSWLARNGFAPRDDLIASLAKSIMEPPVSEEEDVIGCSFLLNLVDAFSGVEVIEEQLRTRENYQDISSIMNVGLTYSLLHNSGVDCKGPAQRRELLLRMFKEKHTPLSSDEMSKIDKVQSTFWREWKSKLEEKKRVADHSRALEQIIPGVDITRFLSGDISYIESAVFSLIESVKLEKKHILNDVLRLVDTYGVSRNEVILRYISSILVSEVWTNNDIIAEMAEVRGEIVSCASEVIKTISLFIYPAVDGCNKQRLACIYGLLSDCYLQLEERKESLPVIQVGQAQVATLGLAHFYKVIEQECRRVSSIDKLNFKNIAGLGCLNFKSFSSEVYTHIDESSLESLAKLVENLAAICPDPMPEGLISWQDVYKHYILSLLKNLDSRARTDSNVDILENIQVLICRLEQIYDLCRVYIRLLKPSEALNIVKQYFTVIIPLCGSCGSLPDNSTWQESLVFLLKIWIRLTEEMQEFAANANAIKHISFNPGCLMSILKVFIRLVMEDSISPSQGWGAVVAYVKYGLIGDFATEVFIFCRAMVFSGCGFGAISEVFSAAVSQCITSSSLTPDPEFLNLPHLYLNMLEPILQELVQGSREEKNLYNLLSSLSRMEGDLEELNRVRQEVWAKMVKFADNLQLPSHVRVYALEIMQFITARNIKAFSCELQSNVIPWEGWDESLYTGEQIERTISEGLTDDANSSSRFTSTLVALKSSQLAATISPGTEITPNELLNVERASSCFLKLCSASSTDSHFDSLVAILVEWEGQFVTQTDDEASVEVSDAGNNWSNDDWDEGWESLPEAEPLDKEQKQNPLSVHPLHVCWLETFKKLVKLSRFRYVLRLIDQSLLKPSGILLDEDGARSLSVTLLEIECFAALKLALILPYEATRLQCLAAVEDKLKQEGISDTISQDHELLILVLSSGIISTIITKPCYGTIFSYLCYLVGNFSRRFQETQLSNLTKRERNAGNHNEKYFLSIFARILFPCFVSELVKADQQILAGFLVSKFMHTNASLSLINVVEASLGRYLERQLHIQGRDEFAVEDMSSCGTLKNTINSMRGKLGNMMQSALSLLSSKS